jgi:hypothetical protein
MDFKGKVPDQDFDLVVNLESWASGEPRPRRSLRLEATVQEKMMREWKVEGAAEEPALASSKKSQKDVQIVLHRNFEFKLPLAWLLATPAANSTSTAGGHTAGIAATSKLRLRFSLWQNRLPVDALPVQGWIELQLLSEAELMSGM